MKPLFPLHTASLPWYDLPFTREHLDTVFGSIRQQLTLGSYYRLPRQLDRQTPLRRQWADRALFLSQCCGPDLNTPAGGALQVIARPVFETLDCPAGSYFSHIVARKKQISVTPDIVVNSPTSFSGCTALLEWLAQTGRTHGRCRVSGSHRNSLRQLLAGEADVAAIDAYTWQFVDHSGLVIVDRSHTAAAPPFVCHRDSTIDRQLLFTVLATAYNDNGKSLHLTNLLPADNETYRNHRISSQPNR